jgi:molybdopterin-guanine dinucleotide biosynthesis adapter protein
MIPVISVVGRSNCGKTTYLEKLIVEMKRRGYKVAVIKHDVHGFEIDKPGKDTWRHAQAGADVVCISSPQKVAMIKQVEQELPLDTVVSYITDVDIIFTEGYKRENKRKIEVFRQAVCNEPLCAKEELLALVSDKVCYEDVPHFSLEDPALMADFLAERVIGKVGAEDAMKSEEAAVNKNEGSNTVEFYEMIKKRLLDMEQDGKVFCPQALALAEKFGVKGSVVGQAADDKGLKITGCQLGCFGTSKEEKHGI